MPMYYISRVIRGVEERYPPPPPLEKLEFTLIMAACKLRLYFQAHTIVVLTVKSLKKEMNNSKTTIQLVLWAIELSEFDIQYCLRMALKLKH